MASSSVQFNKLLEFFSVKCVGEFYFGIINYLNILKFKFTRNFHFIYTFLADEKILNTHFIDPHNLKSSSFTKKNINI